MLGRGRDRDDAGVRTGLRSERKEVLAALIWRIDRACTFCCSRRTYWYSSGKPNSGKGMSERELEEPVRFLLPRLPC